MYAVLEIANADDMRECYGAGPAGACCGACAHLQPTVWRSRPSQFARRPPLTTFRCDQTPVAVSWSLQYQGCALFQRAS